MLTMDQGIVVQPLAALVPAHLCRCAGE